MLFLLLHFKVRVLIPRSTLCWVCKWWQTMAWEKLWWFPPTSYIHRFCHPQEGLWWSKFYLCRFHGGVWPCVGAHAHCKYLKSQTTLSILLVSPVGVHLLPWRFCFSSLTPLFIAIWTLSNTNVIFILFLTKTLDYFFIILVHGFLKWKKKIMKPYCYVNQYFTLWVPMNYSWLLHYSNGHAPDMNIRFHTTAGVHLLKCCLSLLGGGCRSSHSHSAGPAFSNPLSAKKCPRCV